MRVHRGPERSEASSRRAISSSYQRADRQLACARKYGRPSDRAGRDCVEELERLGRRHCLMRESFQRIVNRFDSTTAAGLRISRSPCLRLDEHDFPEPVDDVRGARACHAPAAADGVAMRSAGTRNRGTVTRTFSAVANGRRPTHARDRVQRSAARRRHRSAHRETATLPENAVSDRGTLRGLTQFQRTAVLVGVKPLNANEIEERAPKSTACGIMFVEPLANR